MDYALEKRVERVQVLECGSQATQPIWKLGEVDMGAGIALYRLIRPDFDKTLLTNCLTYINREGSLGIASNRDWKALLSMMKDMNCGITPAEKRWAAKPFGKMQNPKASVGMFRSAITGDLWLVILDGCDRISGIVTSRMGSYKSSKELLTALERVSILGRWGRSRYASKIFELYYGTGMPQEVAYERHDSPCMCVCDGSVYWGTARAEPGRIFPVINDKEILLLKNLSDHEKLVPVVNCGLRTLSRPQFHGARLRVEVLDRMHAEYRYP